MEMKKYKLGEIATLGSGATPKSTVQEYYLGGDIPWINSGELSDAYITSPQKFITKLGFDNSSVKLYPKDTVLLAMYGATAGKASLLCFEACTNQAICAIQPNKNILNPLYLKYKLDTMYEYLVGLSSGSARDNLSQIGISNLILDLPSIEEQEKVVAILSSLDSKIATNHSINQNLEAMAKQLYDYWFVQFDFPNEEGKPYKSSGGKMVWNEKLNQDIPETFSSETLGKTCDILLGGTPSTGDESLWGEGYNWLNSGEVAEFPIIKSEKTITEKGLNKSATVLAQKGSVTLSITRYIRPSILGIDACINQSVVAILENKYYSKEFLYPMIANDIPRLMKLRSGANQPHINKDIVEKIRHIVPLPTIMKAYVDKVKPIYDAIIEKAFEIENLTKQRDQLLPLLMNGQVSPLNSD